MPISPITGIAKANDRYRASLRSTWIASPADTTLLVNAVPANVPTIVVVGWGTELETVFMVTGKSGDSSSNYALTGVTRIKGASVNLPENTPVNCLNNEEFFNQYETKINEVIDAVNSSVGVFYSPFIDVADAATMTFNLAAGANRKFAAAAMGANRTFAVSNVLEGVPFMIRLPQGATPRTATWWSGITWQGIESAPSTASYIPASKVGTFAFVCTSDAPGSETYDGWFLGAEV